MFRDRGEHLANKSLPKLISIEFVYKTTRKVAAFRILKHVLFSAETQTLKGLEQI